MVRGIYFKSVNGIPEWCLDGRPIDIYASYELWSKQENLTNGRLLPVWKYPDDDPFGLEVSDPCG